MIVRIGKVNNPPKPQFLAPMKESGSSADSLFGQENQPMLDDIQRLRTNPSLLQLLSHYADLGKEDREIWQKRLMQMEGIEPSETVKLHGELIAFSWVDQNTGHVPCCYHITLAGQRAIQQINGGGEIDGEEMPEIPEKKPFPKFAKKKRAKQEPVLVATE